MNIDTEFNVGDSVCYLSGDNICHSTISKITIEISYTGRRTKNLRFDNGLWRTIYSKRNVS